MIKRWKKKNRVSRQSLKTRNKELIVKNKPKSPVTEAFRSIRTNLEFTSPDKELITIAVTSSTAAEGKSLVIANLAISMAQNGKKIIIIDADMRKPMQHKFFDMTNFVGLSNVLLGKAEIGDGLRETGVEGVKLLSSGFIPPNPAELISSKKMKKTLDEVAATADTVLVDSPPVLPVADSSIIASMVDGVVLITASQQTDEKALMMAMNTLDRVNTNLLGTILNKYSSGRSGKYSEYYHYSYYSDEEK